MINLKSIKTQLIIFLCGFALYLSFKDKAPLFLLTVFLCVVLCIGFESVILFFKERHFAVTESAVISGLIIGYVLSPDNPWWILVLASLFAIFSKYLLHLHKKHLFNPAAFGIFLSIILFGASTQWKGTYMWYILLPFGLYFIYRVRKLEVLIGYGVTALILFGSQSVMHKVPLANVFGYFSYFFIFIMLVEPKTSPVKFTGKLIFGIGVAVLIFILTEAGVRFDAELSSLLIANIFVPILNKTP